MAQRPWFQLRPSELQREQTRILRQWLVREVKPFSPFWADKLKGVSETLTSPSGLDVAGRFSEAELAGAGGPGNPALLLSPTEDGFKKHATRAELLAAARQAGGGGAAGRRNAIWYRYKPVHVHEVGVDRVIAIAYTRADLDRLHLAGARLAEVMGWGAQDALVNLVPAGPSIRFWGLYHAALASRMTALHPRGNGQPLLDSARRGLAMAPASILTVPVEEAEELVQGLASSGTRLANLRMLVPVGPPPSAAVRIRLAQAAQRVAERPVRVQAIWSPETSRVLYGEAPPAAGDPPEATYGLLTYPDLELVQVCDPDFGTTRGNAVPGEVVITSIGWRGTALVRAATGAWVAGIEAQTPHPVTGATVPRIAPVLVQAAWQPQVRTAKGTIRVDLRRIRRVIEPAVLRLGGRHWSARVIDARFVLALDLPDSSPRAELDQLVNKVAAAAGVVPDLRIDTALAQARPQIGLAGPPVGA
ncbi:MAG: hypothetical protein ACR2HR_13195 [Euzebya sp.]